MSRTHLVVGVAGLVLFSGLGSALASTGLGQTQERAETVLDGAGVAVSEPTQVVNDEVVLADLDPTGLPKRAVLVSRLTVAGPQREVIDPASTTNVRYLDRLGRPQVSPEGVVLVVGGERPRALTEARFDKPLPVAVHAQYARDGQVVPAAEIPGSSGEITITYTLTNTTAAPTQLTYPDAAGDDQRSEQPVFIPFQGSLSATLPESAELVQAPGAMLATDEQGRTIARWNVALFPPISEPIQELELTLRTQRAAIPAAQVLLQPTGTGQDPGADFSADLLSGSVEANSEVFDGLRTLDSAAGFLASGTDQLSAGLSALTAGAGGARAASQSLAQGVGALADGADAAASASGSLASGVGQVSDGADDVAAGSRQLAGALGQAATGARLLTDAADELSMAAGVDPGDALAPLIEGGAQIEVGLRQAAARVGGPADPILELLDPIEPDVDNNCPPGATAPPDDDCVTIYQSVRVLRDALAVLDERLADLDRRVARAQEALLEQATALSSISDEVADAARGGKALYEQLCTGTTPAIDAQACERLAAVAEAAGSALDTAAAALPDLDKLLPAIAALDELAATLTEAVAYALQSTERLLTGVETAGLALGEGSPGEPGLAAGMSALNAGLAELADQLDASQAALSGALGLLADGSRDLTAGLEDSATGARQLAGGSRQLAQGAQDAASGAQALAEGSTQVALGTREASSGAEELSSGLDALAGGVQDSAAVGRRLADGATSLQQEGTAPALSETLDASEQVALAEAWLEASAARARDALPYGPPEGAEGNVAYLFTLDEVPAPTSFWERIRAVFGG